MAEEAPVEDQQPQLTEEEKNDHWKQFEKIIYDNLDAILEKRPAFPVTKFAKAILEDVDLDENGERILKKKKKQDKKDKKKKKKKGSESGGEDEVVDEGAAAAAEGEAKPKKDKKKKKKKGSGSDEEEE